MSLRGQDVPIYDSALTPEQKDMALKALSEAVRAGFGATGKKNLVQRTLTQAVTVTATKPTPVGELASAFGGSEGYLEMNVRVPFTFAGGADAVGALLLVDGHEIDHMQAKGSPVALSWTGNLGTGQHNLEVQLWVNTGSITLFDAGWGQVKVTETLL